MIRDITLGQYYPENSILHRLDPRTKIILTFVYIASLFIATNFLAYFVAFLALTAIIKLSKVPLRFMLKGIKSILVIILFTISFNIFFTSGETEFFRFGIIVITAEGLTLAALMAIRLIFLVIGSSVLTLTTSPIQLTDGIEALLKPLQRIKVPAHEIAMMMTIALRFIPILLEETDKIMKAQMARGADFEGKGIVKRAKSLIPLLIPLFISSFRRADDLALAMEARCYRGGEGRTKMHPLKYKKADGYAFLLFLIYLLILVSVRVFL